MTEHSVDLPAASLNNVIYQQETTLLRRVMSSPSGLIGSILLILVGSAALVSTLGWSPFDPLEQHVSDRLSSPNAVYWLGTDQFGRDTFSRVLEGIRLSLLVSVIAVATAALLGTTLGITAGFLGGWVDTITMRVADVFFAFPAILLALTIITALGPGWFNAALAIAIVYTPVFVRVSRGPTLHIRSADYIVAGRGLGFSTIRLIIWHVLPNIASVIIVQVTLSLSWAILTESALSFLGLGTQPPVASLGLMVSTARAFAPIAWWTLAAPSLAIIITVLGLNLLGDALRDALDPTYREQTG